jgi:NADH dehydrogenase
MAFGGRGLLAAAALWRGDRRMPVHRVVIVGGGFGGLYAAQSLKHAPVELTLIDRRNFHLFQPLLYQVATGALSPANIAAPLRSILSRQKNACVLLGEVIGIDAAQRQVRLAAVDGALNRPLPSVPYDTLVVATGARHTYFGHDQWEPRAPGLKTIEDATEIRRRVLSAFEAAEVEEHPLREPEWLTFVVVGGGPTGVELAGALAEIARRTLRRDFRRIRTEAARILLVEGAERVLPTYAPGLSKRAETSLARLGVNVRSKTMVADVGESYVVLRSGEHTQRVPCRVVLWAAGIQASPVGRQIHEAFGCELDGAGRVVVLPDLSVLNYPEVFVIGDLALCRDQNGRPLPGVAPVAMQQGRYVARQIRARLEGRSVASFRYADKGSMATVGRAAAVADLGWLRLWGYPAWLVWLFIHICYLIRFENRLLVLVQWAWNYITWNRSARLITEPPFIRGSGMARSWPTDGP